MTKRRFRCFMTIIILSTLLGGAAWAEGVPFTFKQEHVVRTHPISRDFTSSIVVVPLNYANAQELAATLAPILPPGVTVVPYAPTNSLIISGSLFSGSERVEDEKAQKAQNDYK